MHRTLWTIRWTNLGVQIGELLLAIHKLTSRMWLPARNSDLISKSKNKQKSYPTQNINKALTDGLDLLRSFKTQFYVFCNLPKEHVTPDVTSSWLYPSSFGQGEYLVRKKRGFATPKLGGPRVFLQDFWPSSALRLTYVRPPLQWELEGPWPRIYELYDWSRSRKRSKFTFYISLAWRPKGSKKFESMRQQVENVSRCVSYVASCPSERGESNAIY